MLIKSIDTTNKACVVKLLNRKANQPYTDVKREKKMCYLMCRKCSAKSIFHFMSTSEAKDIVL